MPPSVDPLSGQSNSIIFVGSPVPQLKQSFLKPSVGRGTQSLRPPIPLKEVLLAPPISGAGTSLITVTGPPEPSGKVGHTNPSVEGV